MKRSFTPTSIGPWILVTSTTGLSLSETMTAFTDHSNYAQTTRNIENEKVQITD